MLFCKKRKEFLQMPMKSGLKEFLNFSKILKLTTVGSGTIKFLSVFFLIMRKHIVLFRGLRKMMECFRHILNN